MKRIVTGHDELGRSVVVHEGAPPREISLDAIPGLRFFELWATDSTPSLPVPFDDPTLLMDSLVAGPGGSRFRLVLFPPAPQGQTSAQPSLDPEAVRSEAVRQLPGLAETLEADFRMHQTATVDYGIVVSGEIWMELDEGREVHLKAGDCVVQNGTRHGWSNRGREACLVAFAMIGATAGTGRNREASSNLPRLGGDEAP